MSASTCKGSMSCPPRRSSCQHSQFSFPRVKLEPAAATADDEARLSELVTCLYIHVGMQRQSGASMGPASELTTMQLPLWYKVRLCASRTRYNVGPCFLVERPF